MSLRRKLHPTRFPELSGRMAAVVGYVLGESWAEPAITDLAIAVGGVVFAATTEDPCMNSLIGSASDVRRNWAALLDAAGLDTAEREVAERLFATRVRRVC